MEVKQLLTQVQVFSGPLHVLSNSCFCTRHTYAHTINSNACIADTLHFCFRLKPLELQTSWLQNTKKHLIAKYMLTGRKKQSCNFCKSTNFLKKLSPTPASFQSVPCVVWLHQSKASLFCSSCHLKQLSFQSEFHIFFHLIARLFFNNKKIETTTTLSHPLASAFPPYCSVLYSLITMQSCEQFGNAVNDILKNFTS